MQIDSIQEQEDIYLRDFINIRLMILRLLLPIDLRVGVRTEVENGRRMCCLLPRRYYLVQMMCRLLYLGFSWIPLIVCGILILVDELSLFRVRMIKSPVEGKVQRVLLLKLFYMK